MIELSDRHVAALRAHIREDYKEMLRLVDELVAEDDAQPYFVATGMLPAVLIQRRFVSEYDIVMYVAEVRKRRGYGPTDFDPLLLEGFIRGVLKGQDAMLAFAEQLHGDDDSVDIDEFIPAYEALFVCLTEDAGLRHDEVLDEHLAAMRPALDQIDLADGVPVPVSDAVSPAVMEFVRRQAEQGS